MKPWAYYNEFDEHAADWLENLIALGLIAPGVVDRRSIEDVRPDDLVGFRQCHFFAGIGVWSYALRRAGFSDDLPVWTGSPPCQPFSAAGKGSGVDDERHLWPALYHLIQERRPVRFFGEQVASKDGLGWLDLVFDDLEAAQYAFGPLDTCSAGSGAPHIRQRLRLAAYDLRSPAGGVGDGGGSGRIPAALGSVHRGEESARARHGEPERSGDALRLVNGIGSGLEGQRNGFEPSTGQRQGSLRPVATAGGIEWVACGDDNERRPDIALGRSEGRTTVGWSGAAMRMADDDDFEQWSGRDTGGAAGEGLRFEPGGCDEFDRMANADGWQPEQPSGERSRSGEATGRRSHCEPDRRSELVERMPVAGPTNGFWGDADWLFCRDGKWRPVEPGTFPLVDGAAFRMGSGSTFEGKSRQGMLKGYGNAIDAQATIDFLKACFEYEVDQARRDAALRDFEDILG